MPFIATTIELTDQIRRILVSFSNSRSLPLHQVQRSKIIILAADGLNNNEISSRVRLDQIEIWFGIINRQLLKRKSYTSIEELEESILQFIKQYNISASPFKWTYAGVPLAA